MGGEGERSEGVMRGGGEREGERRRERWGEGGCLLLSSQ